MDNDRGGRSSGGRGLAGREPSMRGGSYHPINPKVLLGGNKRGQDYDNDDMASGYLGGASSSSAVSKKFVSPTLGSNGNAGGKKPQE